MKRALSLSLTLLLLALYSCGGSGSSNDSSSGDTTTAPASNGFERLDEMGEKDLSGKTFTILDANDHPDMHVNMPGESMNGDIVNDALYTRDSYIEERYKVDIKYEQMTLGETGRVALRNCVLSDDDEYQLIITPLVGNTSLATLATEGMLANLADSEYMSLDQNWWSSLMYDSLRLNDKMYYTTGDISPTMYQMPSCFFINTSLAEDYGIKTDFCQLVRDGKWTLDEAYAITKDLNKDVNEDGKMNSSDDFFGFVHQPIGGLVTDGLLTTAGVKLASITDDGKGLKVDLANENTLDVIENVKRFVIPDISYTNHPNDIINKAFKEDRALTLYHYTESASVHLRDMKSDYLILPMPKADESQANYQSYCNPWVDAFVAIPSIADLEFAGFVTEALGYYSYEKVRPLAYDLTYHNKTARDDNSAEMLDIIFNTLYIDFQCIYNFGKTNEALTKAIKGSSLATEMAAIQSAVDSEIEALIENWN